MSEGHNVSLNVDLPGKVLESAWQLNPDERKALTSEEGYSFMGKAVVFSVTRGDETKEYKVERGEKGRFVAMKDIAGKLNEQVSDIRLGKR